MISIPCTIINQSFEKQISFFQFQHLEVYGKDAINKAIIPIVKYNHADQEPQQDVTWDMKLPYLMVDSIYDYIDRKEQWFVPINVFTAAKQVIKDLDDDIVVEIIDADLVHLKPHPKAYDRIGYDMVIADSTYEDWHMHISKPDSENRNIIDKYLTHSEEGYMNGGFNVIGRVKTIKKIIDDVINYSLAIVDQEQGNHHSWWCAMYALNIACHNHKIKMVNADNCFYPNINRLIEDHYIAHYSCDPLFDKHKLPNVEIDKFPNNLFYNQAKKWITQL